ncbi:hypothetical protein C8R43DRAFT_1126990 [Mycena crocata]|nr:hypothetical protein C8R43DRAFT_1126990 [Mycena crocata]
MQQNIHSRSEGFKLASSMAEDLGLTDYRFPYMTEDDCRAANVKLQTFLQCSRSNDELRAIVPNFAAHFLHPLVAAYKLKGAGGCYGTAMLLVMESPYFVKFLQKNDRRLFVHHTREMLKLDTVDLSPLTVLTWLKIFVELDIYSKLFYRRVRQLPAPTRDAVLKWILCVKNETARRMYTNNQGHLSNVAPNKAVIGLCDSLMDSLRTSMTWEEITSSSPIFTARGLSFHIVGAVEQQLIVAKNISGLTGPVGPVTAEIVFGG